MHPAVSGSAVCDTPTAFARVFMPGGPCFDIRIRYGFTSERHARTWLLTPEGQELLRKAYLAPTRQAAYAPDNFEQSINRTLRQPITPTVRFIQ